MEDQKTAEKRSANSGNTHLRDVFLWNEPAYVRYNR
jgi:hypothetical protein